MSCSFPCQLSSYELYISKLASSNLVESEKTVENEEWRVATEPCLAGLEAESDTKSSRIEELEVEKQRMEVKVAEGRVSELEASNVSLNRAWDEAIAKQISVQEELAYYKSENYKKNILDDFKSFAEYGVEVSRERQGPI